MTSPDHRAALVESAGQFGSLDLLVNNASTLGPSPLPRLEDYPLAALRHVYEVNVIAPLALIQEALPLLRRSHGTVVSLSSDAAVEGYEGWGGYGSSKAALDQLQHVLAAEEPRLRIYQFDPGDMRTAMHQAAFPGEDISDRPEPESVVAPFRACCSSRMPRAAATGPRTGWDSHDHPATPPERYTYELPDVLEASEPPEARGLTRDAVRMLVSYRATGSLVPSSFIFLPSFLEPGDLLVINTSGTLPAAVDAVADDGTALVIHLSTQLDEGQVGGRTTSDRRSHHRAVDRTAPATPAPAGRGRIADAGRALRSTGTTVGGHASTSGSARSAGSPHTVGRSATATSTVPGPSRCTRTSTPPNPAAPRCRAPVDRSRRRRSPAWWRRESASLPLVLHTGVASLEADELPYPERMHVPESTAERVNAAHRGGHRVIAVGTTVVRALETSVGDDGTVGAYDGWTDLVISPERGVKLVDGMITGWHEPASSHLMMLEAIAGRELLRDSYGAAVAQGYRWHEFGDVHLILP